MTDKEDRPKSNVVSLYTSEPMESDEITPNQVNEELVASLNELLKMAENGELHSGIFCGSKLDPSGHPLTSTNFVSRNTYDNIFFAIGSIDAVKMGLHERLLEYEREWELGDE